MRAQPITENKKERAAPIIEKKQERDAPIIEKNHERDAGSARIPLKKQYFL
jgi:hypothetical protein